MRLSLIHPYLSALTDYFVPPGLRADRDKYHRGRILIKVMLTFALLPLVAYAIVVITRIPFQYGRMICLPVAALFMCLLILVRRDGNILFCSLAAVAAALAAVVAGIFVSGGPAESPAVQLLVIPPLMAYFFGGLRWGRYAVATLFPVLIVLVGLHLDGHAFIQTIDSESQMTAARAVVGVLNLCVISAMALIYEITSVALKKERDAEYARYAELAKTDPLTGLANRRNFDALLADRMARGGAASPPHCFALGYLDLDGFKPINDRYGHAVGDEVLRVVADRLRAALRENDFVGRHGGDEFMLCLETIEDEAVVEAMAQRILGSIALPIETTAGPVQVTGSLGFAMYPLDSLDIEGLKKSADAAMYEAKRHHGTWRYFRRTV